MVKKTTISFSPKLDRILKELSEAEGTTKTEIVRKAIAFYNYLYKETHEKNQKLIISSSTGDEAKEILFQ